MMTNVGGTAVEGRLSARLNFVISQGQVTNNILIHLLTFNIEAKGNIYRYICSTLTFMLSI